MDLDPKHLNPSQTLKMGNVLGEPFEIIKVLKTSPIISTYLAKDNETGKKVVLKTLDRKRASSDFEIQLQQEVALHQKIRGPQSGPLFTGSTPDHFYVVLPYVEGETLRHWMKGGPLSWEKTLTFASEFFSELEQIHSQGIIHRDLKPENIVVRPYENSFDLNLIDFGSAWSAPFAGLNAVPLVGTFLYLSPEQSGATVYEADERSDLYSAGVVLFECLTGHTPFVGESIGELLREQLTGQPPDIRAFQASTPRSLCEIVLHLLTRDPKDRYQTARAVREDLLLVQSHWMREHKDPNLIAGLTDKRAALGNPSFVGREEELSSLQKLLEHTASGRGGIAFVEAESGEGKSRLLREFRQKINLKEISVLCGQGVDQVAQLPFHVLTGVAGDALKRASEDSIFSSFLTTQLNEWKETLVSVLPSLHTLFPGLEKSSMGPETFGEQRCLDALATLLSNLGSKEKPALIILDDCQWADELTLKLFHYWNHVKPKSCYALLLILFRSEEIGPAHSLRALTTLKTLRLRPLNKDQISLLAQTMAGPLPAAVLELLFALSQGSPFMAAAVLRGLVETDTLVFVSGSWAYNPRSLQQMSSSEKAVSVLKKRFSILPNRVLTLLKTGAVLGKEFDLYLLSALSEVPLQEVKEGLAHAEDRHILWQSGESTFVFVHDKLRETLLSLMPEVERKARHKTVAEWLENSHVPTDFEISYHYDAAGLPRKSFPYAIRSAYSARARYSLEIAEEQFRIAERGIEPGDTTTLRTVAEALGDVLMLRGKYEEAAQYLTMAKMIGKAAGSKTSALESATVDLKLGDLQFKRGDLESAAEALESGLKELGHTVPHSKLDLVVRLIHEGSLQFFHTLFPLFLGKRSFEGKEEELLRMKIHSRLAYTYWFKSGRLACLWTHLKGLNLAERYTPSLELAQAYSEHAPIATLVAQFERGIRYAERSHQVRTKLQDVWGQGQSLSFIGVGLYCASRYREAIQKCQEAVRILNRTGDRWEVNTAQWHIAYCLCRLGEYKKAIEVSQYTYQSALRIGDIHAMGISLSGWAKAAGGQVPEELLRDRLKNLDTDDIHTSCELYQAEAIRLIATHRPSQAEDVLLKACELIKKKGMYSEYTVGSFIWVVTALRKQLFKTQSYEQVQRKIILKRALKASKRALHFARRFKNHLPHALREQAILECFQGKSGQALRHFNQSLKLARLQEALGEEARTQLMLAKFGKDFGWKVNVTGPEALEKLRKMGAYLPFEDETYTETERRTLSLVDRFSTLLDVGRKIATTSHPEQLYRSIYTALTTLFRSESCTIVRSNDTNAQILFGDPKVISNSLLKETERKGCPLVFLGNQALDTTESVLLTEMESSLCIPVFASSKIDFFVLLTHRRVQNLFGPDEKRIAEFISSIAGAALENQRSVVALKENAERLLQSNEELERYAFLASHDLQEPLRNLQLTSQLLSSQLESKEDNEIQRHLGIITDSSRRMRSMITDLLAYAQLTSAEKKKEPVSLMEVLEAALSNLAAQIDELHADIKFDFLPKVLGNKGQLISVFQNLLNNSLKFHFALPPKISIRSEIKDGFCHLRFEDNGVGFPPNQGEDIFKLFKRLNPTETSQKGTGIGLATCRKIILSHGGKIWAEGQPFQGSQFHLTLPLEKTAD